MSPASAALAPRRPPTECGGLRRSLLHDWQLDFPLEPSPFQHLARRHGGSLRELLQHCQGLVAEGACAGLQVRWHPRLGRCGLRLATGDEAGLRQAAALADELPGLTGWHLIHEVLAGPGGPLPPGLQAGAGWLDLHAMSAPLLQAQQTRLLQATPGRAWWLARHVSRPLPCDCPLHDGPCADPGLAGRCELGLPVVAHPYLGLAHALHRSERQVLATLRQWRQSGRMVGLGLTAGAGGAAAGPRQVAMALVDNRLFDGLDEAQLALRPAVVAVHRCTALAPAGPWGETSLVELAVPPQADAALLVRALRQAGLGAHTRAVLRAAHHGVRPQPLLFAPPVQPLQPE